MTTLKAVRGTRDLLPPETALWNRIETVARSVFERYSFGEIRTPIFEDTSALFARGVGEETDIVSKEMYTWEDRSRAQSEKNQSLTLRPENTAGVVRAYIEHKLGETGALQKLYYIGPQFRRERPQKGRYRQFSQIGAEVTLGPASAGSESPLRDAEVLEMLATLLDELGITGWTLKINSCRLTHPTALPTSPIPPGEALEPGRQGPDVPRLPAPRGHQSCCASSTARSPTTSPSSRRLAKDRRLARRILARPLRRSSCAALDAAGVKYERNPTAFVRGLDYYTRTTFEFTHGGLGAQNALLGGGRYDGLSEMIGGPKAPGIGFAMGEDRLVLTLLAGTRPSRRRKNPHPRSCRRRHRAVGEAQLNPAALELARELRRGGLKIDLGDGSLPPQKILRNRGQDRPQHRPATAKTKQKPPVS